MIRPVAYYQTAQTATEPLPVMEPSLPAGAGKVCAMFTRNPALWWLSTAAIFFYCGCWGNESGTGNSSTFERFNVGVSKLLIPGLHFTWFLTGSLTCCLTGDALQLFYHYMGASVFAGLAAWLVDRCIVTDPNPRCHRYISSLAFVFWMPVYLGLPLSPQSYGLRMWLRSWI